MIRLNTDQAQTLLAFIRERGDAFINELIGDRLEYQLVNPSADIDLIDTLTGLMMGSPGNRGSNLLGGTTLQRIRAALLTPRELHALKNHKGLACAGCGKDFRVDEMVTMHQDASFCFRCLQPVQVASTQCSHDVALDGSIHRAVTKLGKACEQCAAINRGEQPALPVDAEPRGEWGEPIVLNRPAAPSVAPSRRPRNVFRDALSAEAERMRARDTEEQLREITELQRRQFDALNNTRPAPGGTNAPPTFTMADNSITWTTAAPQALGWIDETSATRLDTDFEPEGDE